MFFIVFSDHFLLLFLRPVVCLTSTLLETEVGANDCKCSRDQWLNVPSEARILKLCFIYYMSVTLLYLLHIRRVTMRILRHILQCPLTPAYAALLGVMFTYVCLIIAQEEMFITWISDCGLVTATKSGNLTVWEVPTQLSLYRASHGYATWRESSLNTVDGIFYWKKTLSEFIKQFKLHS
jgi:hypothetical protein